MSTHRVSPWSWWFRNCRRDNHWLLSTRPPWGDIIAGDLALLSFPRRGVFPLLMMPTPAGCSRVNNFFSAHTPLLRLRDRIGPRAWSWNTHPFWVRDLPQGRGWRQKPKERTFYPPFFPAGNYSFSPKSGRLFFLRRDLGSPKRGRPRNPLVFNRGFLKVFCCYTPPRCSTPPGVV